MATAFPYFDKALLTWFSEQHRNSEKPLSGKVSQQKLELACMLGRTMGRGPSSYASKLCASGHSVGLHTVYCKNELAWEDTATNNFLLYIRG